MGILDEDFGKIFEGSYVYHYKNKPYGEENFTVMQNRQKDSTRYFAEALSRLTTGELLKIKTYYEVDLKWQPVKVIITKTIGTDRAEEMFICNHREGTISYQFQRGKNKKILQLNLSGSYQIATPTFTTAALYLHQKNPSNLGRTRYILITSPNDWEFEGEISDQSVFIEPKMTDGPETMKIGENNLPVKTFYLYAHDKMENVEESPISFHMSKHVGLPYVIEPAPDTKISIKKLQDFDIPTYDSDGSYR